ncbi:MAG: L-aspartate oxidase, partial [Planctomycetes bacterium]|nr:L-aspartate oxidase [Planctomycetota bacterium]
QMIEGWCRYVLVRQFRDPEGWELQNMLTVARVVVRAALARQESRGVHSRTDFPETNNQQWQRHLTFDVAND